MPPFLLEDELESEASIKKLKARYVDEVYAETTKQQKEDDKYINDTFEASAVREPHKVLRLGIGHEIVNSPAEQIVTSNPQVFVKVLKRGKWVEDEQSSRISAVFNGWVNVLRRQNPNPFKETVKNKLGRGENYIKLAHNQTYVTKDKKGYGLPIFFVIPDPMVIFGSPEEDDNGIPTKVIVFYERQLQDVVVRYPEWQRPPDKKERKTVEWFEYWDADTKHFEADGVVVLRKPNIYKFSSYIRKYSGFGRRSPDGELANLIVSDIKNSRGLIEEICVMESDIASTMHLSAHKAKLILAAGKVNREQLQELHFGAYDINVIDEIGDLSQFKIDDLPLVPPSLEAYQHLASLKADLRQRHPYIMAGFPMGTSGRQQGMSDVSAMRRYDTVVENTETEWATAFEQSLKICKAVPTLLPVGLQKIDLDATIKCTVKLKAKDPIEQNRLVLMGSRLLLNKEIDPMTNLVEFKGYTKEKAKQILIDTLKWEVLLNSPEIRSLIGLRAAEKAGMLEDLRDTMAQRQQLEQGGMGQALPPTTQQRIRGEVGTELGMEREPEEIRGARQMPAQYTRAR